MTARPVGPARMFGRLWAGAMAVGVPVCAAIVPFAWLATPLSAEARADVPSLALCLLAAMAVAVAVAAAAVVQRTRPLYRALRRVDDPEWGSEAPPPSIAALRDAFDAPRWMAGVTAAVLLAVLAFHASGSALFPDLLGGRRLVFDLMAGAMLALGILPATLIWRRMLWSWVGRVRPAEAPATRAGSVSQRSVHSVVLPVGSVLLACLAVWVAHAAVDTGTFSSDLRIFVAMVAVFFVVGVVARFAGQWVGRLVRDDLAALRSRIEGVLGAAGPHEHVAATRRILRTEAVSEVGRRVAGLTERHARSAAEEARAHRTILQVRQLKDRFMAYMSHDLRSPLNSIKGFSEILANGTDGPLNTSQQESVEMIRESGESLLQLVNDILDFAKLESGRLELRKEWTPSVEILTEAVERARVLVAGRPIEIATELEPGLPPVRVDRDRIVQAVVGILGHVIAPMRAGTIRLRARVLPRPGGGGRQLRVEVIDESASLRPEDRDRLFETLRAIREPSGKRIGGLGLGLSLARGLVTAHGGDVWYEAHGDRGTTFSVALDLEPARSTLTSGEGP